MAVFRYKFSGGDYQLVAKLRGFQFFHVVTLFPPCLIWSHWLRHNRWEVLVRYQKYEWGGS